MKDLSVSLFQQAFQLIVQGLQGGCPIDQKALAEVLPSDSNPKQRQALRELGQTLCAKGYSSVHLTTELQAELLSELKPVLVLTAPSSVFLSQGSPGYADSVLLDLLTMICQGSHYDHITAHLDEIRSRTEDVMRITYTVPYTGDRCQMSMSGGASGSKLTSVSFSLRNCGLYTANRSGGGDVVQGTLDLTKLNPDGKLMGLLEARFNSIKQVW